MGGIGCPRWAPLHSAVISFVARLKRAHFFQQQSSVCFPLKPLQFWISPGIAHSATATGAGAHSSSLAQSWNLSQARQCQAERWYALQWHRGADSGYCLVQQAAGGRLNWLALSRKRYSFVLCAPVSVGCRSTVAQCHAAYGRGGASRERLVCCKRCVAECMVCMDWGLSDTCILHVVNRYYYRPMFL